MPACGKKDQPRLALDFPETDEGAGRLDFGFVRELGMNGFPVPDAEQREHGGIENPIREPVQIRGQIEELLGFRVHLNPLAAGGFVDSGDDRVRTEAGELRFKGRKPVECGGEELPGDLVRGMTELDDAMGSQGAKLHPADAAGIRLRGRDGDGGGHGIYRVWHCTHIRKSIRVKNSPFLAQLVQKDAEDAGNEGAFHDLFSELGHHTYSTSAARKELSCNHLVTIRHVLRRL